MNLSQMYLKLVSKLIAFPRWSLLFFLLLASLTGVAQSDCDCADYIYLNDTELDVIHKFKVDPSTGGLTEVGSPWSDLSENWDPHGIASDLNGFLYIANTLSGDVRKFSSEGVLLDDEFIENSASDITTSNFGSFDGYIYFMDVDEDLVKAYSLCDGTLVGSMQVSSTDDVEGWGFYIDDENWYMSDRLSSRIVRGSLDISLFTTPATNSGATFISSVSLPMGITRDDNGNTYVINNQNFEGTGSTPTLSKYDASGTFVTSITDIADNGNNLTDGVTGFWGSRGVTYSKASGMLYTGNFENCITVFNTNLIEQTALNINNSTNSDAKGIGIMRECCPNQDLSFSETICSTGDGEKIFLQDVFDCGEGVLTEGQWSIESANANQVFNDCDLSITVNGSGCGTYVLEKTTGATGVQQCGAYKITLQICTEVPESILTPAQGTCTGSVANNDASIAISDAINIDAANYSVGAAYTGPDYGGAGQINVSSGTGSITGLSHNTEYTVRLFNNSNDCFVDITSSTLTIECSAIACVNPEAGVDAEICQPKSTLKLKDAPAEAEWVAAAGNTATIDASTGAITGMTDIGTYTFTLRDITDNTCSDDIIITVTANTPILLCNDGSTSITATAEVDFTDVIWFNSAGTQVGTGNSLIIDSNVAGLEDGNDWFYYTAKDANDCDVELCCPVVIITEDCCPTPNCLGVTVIED